MNHSITPKHLAAALWSGLAVLVVAALVVYQGSRRVAVQAAAGPSAEAAPADQRLVDAAGQVARLQALSAGFAPDSNQALLALAPVRVQAASQPGTGSVSSSLVIVQVGRRSVAVIDGRLVKVGETLPDGGRVQQIGKTFVVLVMSGGDIKRLDMHDRFLPRTASVPQETFK